MYESFFGFQCKPFSTVPDPSFLFWSKTHDLSFTMLRYGIMSSAQITVVTGEIGAGKTTLVRHLLSELPEWITVGLVSNAQAGRGELLHYVMMALELPFREEPYVRLLERFQDYVVECHAAGRRVVLIFDEAQNLNREMLEELRMLSNINADGEALIQLILVGQPELRTMVRHPSMVQFAQRVSSDFHLDRLRYVEVPDYIRHRVFRAGVRRRLFSDRACSLIAQATDGTPRIINILADLCLCAAYATETGAVDADVVDDVLQNARETGSFSQFRPIERGPTLVLTDRVD